MPDESLTCETDSHTTLNDFISLICLKASLPRHSFDTSYQLLDSKKRVITANLDETLSSMGILTGSGFVVQSLTRARSVMNAWKPLNKNKLFQGSYLQDVPNTHADSTQHSKQFETQEKIFKHAINRKYEHESTSGVPQIQTVSRAGIGFTENPPSPPQTT